VSPRLNIVAVVLVAAVAIAAAVLATSSRQEDDGTNNMTFASNVSNSSSSTANVSGQERQKVENVFYNVKFECGTIQGSEGPLRPGHYDTDIGIFNKQDFPVGMTWTVIVNDGTSTNAILKMLQPQSSTSIVCQDLSRSFGDGNFTEGFVRIHVPLDPGLLASLSGGIAVLGGTEIDLLEVQAFYTANALDELPHEVLVDKITFTIVNDTSGKIPQSMVMKILDITVPSAMNEISDPESKVKQALAEKYSLSEQELAGLEIEIQSVGVGVGTMIDDHAISHSIIMPQAG
jgi:hypothetical protein